LKTAISGQVESEFLTIIPVLKLPAFNLEKSLGCLVSTKRGLRKEVVSAVLRDIYPNMNEKRAFRALVAPVLTRLHFARSDPPFFRAAPNARIWKTVEGSLKKVYTSIVLFDFATVRLGLRRSMIPPTGSLRQIASHSAKLVDRVRGLDSMLRFYASFHPDNSDQVLEKMAVAKPNFFNGRENQLRKVLLSALPPQRMTSIDEARYLVQESLQSQSILASSFVIDEWLKTGIRERIISYAKAPYASISSLMLDRIAINAIVSLEEPAHAKS
jgi:hypothetical protein